MREKGTYPLIHRKRFPFPQRGKAKENMQAPPTGKARRATRLRAASSDRVIVRLPHARLMYRRSFWAGSSKTKIHRLSRWIFVYNQDYIVQFLLLRKKESPSSPRAVTVIPGPFSASIHAGIAAPKYCSPSKVNAT